jgi:hypothetical protein
MLALAVVVLGMGCGGGNGRLSKSAYERTLKRAGTNLKTALSAADLGEAENLDSLANSLMHLRKTLAAAARDLAGLKPPSDAVTDNAKLVAVLRKAGPTVAELERAARADSERRVVALNNRARKILQGLRVAAGDLKSKGYEVGLLGEG